MRSIACSKPLRGGMPLSTHTCKTKPLSTVCAAAQADCANTCPPYARPVELGWDAPGEGACSIDRKVTSLIFSSLIRSTNGSDVFVMGRRDILRFTNSANFQVKFDGDDSVVEPQSRSVTKSCQKAEVRDVQKFHCLPAQVLCGATRMTRDQSGSR